MEKKCASYSRNYPACSVKVPTWIEYLIAIAFERRAGHIKSKVS
jgi:hypothetical protein